jgi:hypothetical protein
VTASLILGGEYSPMGRPAFGQRQQQHTPRLPHGDGRGDVAAKKHFLNACRIRLVIV